MYTLSVSLVIHQADTHLPLPRPFWLARPGLRREVPGLPKLFGKILRALPVEERRRWHACRSQLSQALSVWAEDPHAAASAVWQALEAFVPPGDGGWRRVLLLSRIFAEYATAEMRQHLAHGVVRQRDEIESAGGSCDWPWWDETSVSFERWVGRILTRPSAHHYSSWRTPPAPAVLFHQKVGLMWSVVTTRGENTTPPWLLVRIESDLRPLYGLRNAIVHNGERLLSPEAAIYLAQLGLEVLFGVMRRRAEALNIAPARVTAG